MWFFPSIDSEKQKELSDEDFIKLMKAVNLEGGLIVVYTSIPSIICTNGSRTPSGRESRIVYNKVRKLG